MQFPEELQHVVITQGAPPACLNEVQFPEELQPLVLTLSRSACGSLNEVQFPEELQLRVGRHPRRERPASMKCSSRRNCSQNGSDP